MNENFMLSFKRIEEISPKISILKIERRDFNGREIGYLIKMH